MKVQTQTTTTPDSRTRTKRRWLRSASITMALAPLGLLINTSPADAASSWQYYQTDSDACYDAAGMDADRNGYTESIWLDLDNDCRWDTHAWNSVGADNFLESVTYDMDEDGRWNVWMADTDQRVGFDMVYVDDNRDGRWDRSISMYALQSGNALINAKSQNAAAKADKKTNDMVLEQIVRNNFTRIYGVPPFGPSVSVWLRGG